MKKIFCATMILAATFTVSAQEVVAYKSTTSDVDYSSQVPTVIRTNFQANYPTVTTATWMPVANDWWYATYKENNRIVRVYYNTQPWYMMRGESFKASLPVLNTFVPDQVILNAINTYGNDLYSITKRLSTGDEEVYHVTVIKNGISEVISMNRQGVVVVYTDLNKREVTNTKLQFIVN
ncbi:MAG TPA: hypothetical protein VGQ04_19370 [Chitinophagaceae bacterium]|jgi:hypothetical protein|nr:hypothetical protein [Chitinophagaceae bacterium]